MKICLLISLSIFVNLISCQNQSKNLPTRYLLKNKYVVIDGSSSPNLHYCSDEIKEFEQMAIYDCSFTIEEIEFNIREKYVLDDNGNLKEYWLYKSEGPLIYTTKQLERDLKFKNSIGKVNSEIVVNEKGTIETESNLKIEKIFKRQKLILTQNINETETIRKKVMYEYK